MVWTQSRKAKRSVVFKRAEQYVNEYKQKEREEIRLRRAAKVRPFPSPQGDGR